MSLLLLDTTFLIDTERDAVDLDDTIGDDDDLAVAAITIAELLLGVLLASPTHRGPRSAYVEDILDSMPVVAYDERIAAEHAELLAAVREQGRPRGAHDLIIAATARALGRTVVTADAHAFSDLPGVSVRKHR